MQSIIVLSIGATLLFTGLVQAAGNAEAGKRTFQSSCAACHAITPENKPMGPHLVGIIGRRAGSVSGFKYSKALTEANIVWDEKNLNEYFASPSKVVPGTSKLVNVPRELDRLNLIEYLKTIQ